MPNIYARLARTARVVFCLSFALAALAPVEAGAWDRGAVQRFATLPAGALNPEGIAVAANGEVFAGGFDPTGAAEPQIYVFDREGRFARTLLLHGTSPALLGLAFHPDGRLLVLDFGAGQVLEVDPYSGASSVLATIGTPAGTPGHAGLNALAFDGDGNIYVSGSFSGAIYRIAPSGGSAETWAQSDELLKTSGFPPFGANGLGFNHDRTALFVANTGNDTIVRIPVNGDGSAGNAEVFTNSINGADGLIVDEHDNLWVCANQGDEIVVIDSTGKALAKLGDFEGVKHGSPVGLLFPASLARSGDWIYITNLSLDTTKIGLPQSVDSQWAAQVTRHTISRIRARIPH